MRGSKVKSQRRDRPDRPNPGRKFGGSDKQNKDRQAWIKSRVKRYVAEREAAGNPINPDPNKVSDGR